MIEGRLTEGLGEESDTLAGDSVVVPLPVENLGEVALGDEGLDDHHDLKVGHISDVLMVCMEVVSGDNEDALLQQVGENSFLLGFAHKYRGSSFADIHILSDCLINTFFECGFFYKDGFRKGDHKDG